MLDICYLGSPHSMAQPPCSVNRVNGIRVSGRSACDITSEHYVAAYHEWREEHYYAVECETSTGSRGLASLEQAPVTSNHNARLEIATRQKKDIPGMRFQQGQWG